MILQADAARIPLKDKTVHCVVTSPPYWGLRKYTGEQGRGEYPNLGLEPTPEEHIERMVTIFREVKRVLRDDGVVWLNYGDCYASSKESGGTSKRVDGGKPYRLEGIDSVSYPLQQGNLMLMPHRVAIALQDDGWIVRNDLIWFKRNPMPESCAGWSYQFDPISKQMKRNEELIKKGKDPKLIKEGIHERVQKAIGQELYELFAASYGEEGWLTQPRDSWRHTRAHEYIFMLTPKMQYWCNQEAVRETQTGNTHSRGTKLSPPKEKAGADAGHGHLDFTRYTPDIEVPGGRNPRSVLDIPAAPYKGAHYATFPPNLIAPLIRASCPRRACPECGQGWAAVVERKYYGTLGGEDRKGVGMTRNQFGGQSEWDEYIAPRITDYRPTCECGHDEYVPGIVLDPFIGSGTTGAVARELQRRWVGLDISYEYLDEQAKVRALNLTPSKALDDLPMFGVASNDET